VNVCRSFLCVVINPCLVIDPRVWLADTLEEEQSFPLTAQNPRTISEWASQTFNKVCPPHPFVSCAHACVCVRVCACGCMRVCVCVCA